VSDPQKVIKNGGRSRLHSASKLRRKKDLTTKENQEKEWANKWLESHSSH